MARWIGTLLLLAALAWAGVDELVQQLSSADPKVRKDAAVELGRMGRKASDAEPALRKALEDEDREVRRAAAWALERVSAGPGKTDPDSLRREGKERFDSVKELWKRFVLDGYESLTDDEINELLESYDRCLELYSEALEADPEGPGSALLLMLAKRLRLVIFAKTRREEAKKPPRPPPKPLPPKPETPEAPEPVEREPEPDRLEVLAKRVRTSEGAERRKAATELGKLGEPALPVIREMLEAEDRRLQANAALALYHSGKEARSALYALMDLLGDESAPVRVEAAQTLGLIGPKASPAVPLLMVTLKDKDAGVRAEAAGSLGRIGPAAKQASRHLGDALRDEEPKVRHSAALALGEVGPAAARGIPGLLRALEGEEDRELQKLAVSALGNIGPEAATVVPAVQTHVRSHSREVRAAAVRAAGQMGPEGKKLAEDLLELLVVEEHEEIREAAFAALKGIGEAALPACGKALKDDRPALRLRTCQALGRMALQSGTAVSALRGALKDDRMEVRDAAAAALGSMGAAAKPAVSNLVKCLKDEEWRVRRSAAKALGEIGPAAKSAVRHLKAAAEDEAPEVRTAAAEAIAAIEKG